MWIALSGHVQIDLGCQASLQVSICLLWVSNACLNRQFISFNGYVFGVLTNTFGDLCILPIFWFKRQCIMRNGQFMVWQPIRKSVQLLLCCCPVVALLVSNCCFAVVQLLLCCCPVVAWLLSRCCFAFIQSVLCCCLVIALVLSSHCFAMFTLQPDLHQAQDHVCGDVVRGEQQVSNCFNLTWTEMLFVSRS